MLRQVGHNAIFAMLAIKAFRMMPSAATPQRIDGVCTLIRSFTPWRDVEPDPDVDPPPFADAAAASQFILREASAAIDRFVGFGQGFAGHMLTFGQSLVELAAMGDVEWAESCRTAFRKYVTVTRRGPEPDSKRRPDHKPSDLRPTDCGVLGEAWGQHRGHRARVQVPLQLLRPSAACRRSRIETRLGCEGVSPVLRRIKRTFGFSIWYPPPPGS